MAPRFGSLVPYHFDVPHERIEPFHQIMAVNVIYDNQESLSSGMDGPFSPNVQ